MKIYTRGLGGGDSLTFMTGVIMSNHFLRPPNMLTKFFKDPKYVEQIFRNPQKLCWPIFLKIAFYWQ